jgi:hypothetical protein
MTYHPQQILSKNGKTGVSIDLPLKGHCSPTKNCAKDCYARCGHQARPDALRKQQWVSDYLLGNDLSSLAMEARQYSAVRLNGSGDLLKGHVKNIIKLAQYCPYTQFWGMTRKKDVAYALNGKNGFPKLPNLRILLSVDATSPEKVWRYDGAMCYGPRRAEDTVPDDPRIITVFPRHHAGRVIKGIPEHSKDCQGVYHRISGCMECARCWSWNGTLARIPNPSLERLEASLDRLEIRLGEIEHLLPGRKVLKGRVIERNKK